MQMQFGQFLDHDITLTPESEVKGCCTNRGLSGVFAADCFPINFPCNDPVFSNLGRTEANQKFLMLLPLSSVDPLYLNLGFRGLPVVPHTCYS